jgi:DDE family transposase
LPRLLDDIKALVDGQSQTDPSFRSTRLYTRLTAAEVRRQLIAQKGYTDAELPTERTISTKLRDLGYHPTKVAKTQPQKRSPRPMPSSTRLPR